MRLQTWASVADVQQFVKTTMPPKGARLTDAEPWDVVAFALSANGITPPGPLTPSSAAALPLGR